MLAADNIINDFNECLLECPENLFPNSENICMNCHKDCLQG